MAENMSNPAESAYREACAAACEWCAKKLERYYHTCSAPTLAVFAQSQSLARVAAEKRADAAEQERDQAKRVVREMIGHNGELHGKIAALEQERDRLWVVLVACKGILPVPGDKSYVLSKRAFKPRWYEVASMVREALATAPATVAEESGNL